MGGNEETMRHTSGWTWRQWLGDTAVAAATLLAASGLCGCLVAGVSSGGGWFIWPGGLGFLLMILVVFLLLRRRR
jgi:hypothetical protein